MHSVRIKPTKLILIGTRTTYQATGDAGSVLHIALWGYQTYLPVDESYMVVCSVFRDMSAGESYIVVRNSCGIFNEASSDIPFVNIIFCYKSGNLRYDNVLAENIRL